MGATQALAVSLLAVLATVACLPAAAGQPVNSAKVDCYPIANATKQKCEALGCVWSPAQHDGVHPPPLNWPGFHPAPNNLGIRFPKSRVQEPWCYHPDGYYGYKVVDTSGNAIRLARARPSALGDDVETLLVTFDSYNGGNVVRLLIRDADKARFEPELPKLNMQPLAQDKQDSAKFVMSLQYNGDEPYLLSLRRAATGAVVFSTDLRKLIFSNKFMQINSQLNSPFIFGLGEHYDTFLKWPNLYKTYSFWNTDRLPLQDGTRSYGGFPLYINLDSVNQTYAHGLYLRNSNAMDIVLQNDRSVTFRPIGGVFDFFLFAGPTPLEVTQQYQQLVGLPDLPPRWSLGFHLCRYNYSTIHNLKRIWQRTRDALIPFDVQWNDIDVLDKFNDFTYNEQTFPGLPEFVDQLHSLGMHYVPIVDPGVSWENRSGEYYPYDRGTELDVWVKNATKQTLIGRVWNQSQRTVFPDFSSPLGRQYWAEMFVMYHNLVKIDGAWIDMNDISNFVTGSIEGCPLDNPLEQTPYEPGGYALRTNTLCLSAEHKAGHEYDVHNLYSFYEAIATKEALLAARPGKRSLIISRSTHPGQGQYGGHWSGDVPSTWNYLRWSIPSLLEHSMYGFTMMGSDICGFSGNTTPELCARWSTLGAFYTFSRNHNDDVSIDQDPAALGADVVAANKYAQTKRYSLLPYLYSNIYKAHKTGVPVARSVAFEFFEQNDKEALRVEEQFMLGPALMVSPVVYESTYFKQTYLPEGRWYETDIMPESTSFNTSVAKMPRVVNSGSGKDAWHATAGIAVFNMPLFYRGGHIVPAYARVGMTVADTERQQPLSLEVALCQQGRAHGELYMDDGESVDDVTNYLTMDADDAKGELSVRLVSDQYMKRVEFGHVKVMGLSQTVTRVEVSGPDGTKSVQFGQRGHLLVVDLGAAPVSAASALTVKWVY